MTSHETARKIVVAGATGALGKKIVRELLNRGAAACALARPTSAGDDIAALEALGARVETVDSDDVDAIARACEGGACVVSALSGLRPVIIGAQTRLLEGASQAGVPRFIPSDFAIDFYKLPAGRNRNLDLRREFADRLAQAPIRATSILNGMFSEFLFTAAPFISFSINRCLYFGAGDQTMDMTAMDDAAAFTAAAAMDDAAPRYLRIAGNVVTPAALARAAEAGTGEPFRAQWAGPLKALEGAIAAASLFDKGEELYSPMQGMQYTHNIFSGLAKLAPLDNDRYPDIVWTPLRDTIAAGKPDFVP